MPVPKRSFRFREFVTDKRVWSCLHEWQCAECGKFLGPVEECPDRVEAP